jgi:hypothetical protein
MRRLSSIQAWGPANGAKVLGVAKDLAGPRPLILTLTHFHPEHGFGAQAFKGAGKIIYNEAQRDELKRKGEAFSACFARSGPGSPRRSRGRKSSNRMKSSAPSCFVPDFAGAFLSIDSKDALWDRFYMGAPQRRSGCVRRQAFR